MRPILFAASARHAGAFAFYQNTMGFVLTEDTRISFAFEAAGTMLRVQKVEDFNPHPFTAIGWEVSDIAAERDRLAARGAAFETFGFLEQDARGIWTAPDGAKVCWFRDPDGNTLSLTEVPG